jgi:hypothetical protein
VLRDLFDRNKVQKGSFTSYLGAKSSAAAAAAARRQTNDDDDDDDDEDYDDEIYQKYSKDASSSYQSYQYYEDAEKEEVPIYKVEPARSDRSKCQKCKTNIPKMGIRIGSIDKDAGSYGRWIHLDCWRVPMKIQLVVVVCDMMLCYAALFRSSLLIECLILTIYCSYYHFPQLSNNNAGMG